MSTTPSVVVIIRTKDRPLMFERAIKSIMDQSYKDLMMVIVNDGGTPDLIDKLLHKHKNLIAGRVRLINNKESIGMQNASNLGIKNSDSKYIAFLDDDDSWRPDFLKTTIDFLENSSYQGVVTASTIISESIDEGTIKKLSQERFAPFINSINYFSMLGINQFPNNSFVYTRSALKKVGEYDEAAGPLGDWNFNKHFMKLYDIAFINLPLANYHHRYDAKGADSNTINTNEHSELTTQMLNKALREDLDIGRLSTGTAANLSNDLHRLHIDLMKDIHATKNMLNGEGGLNSRLIQIEKRLENIEIMTSSFEKRIKDYIRSLPKRAGRKLIRPISHKK